MEQPPALVAAAAPERDDRTPKQFGPYRVLRRIGVGGMGEVWLGERSDGEFEQRVAIKQVAYPTPGLLQRFRQEPVVAGCVLVASTMALFVTPALWNSGDYYLGVMQSEAALTGEGMWAPLWSQAPLDVLFVALAVPLVLFALRFGLQLWEIGCLAAFGTFTLHAGRNSVWLICLVAAPAAAGLVAT